MKITKRDLLDAVLIVAQQETRPVTTAVLISKAKALLVAIQEEIEG